MEKPRVRWHKGRGLWFVLMPEMTTALGYAKWEDAVGYALTYADVMDVFYRKPRVIGWHA